VRIAIMQPYFLPYLGHFQLIGAVDRFVVYDNIKFTKKGWINRNRLLANGEPSTLTLPIRNDSDDLDIRDRYLARDFDRTKLLNKVHGTYRSAPFFAPTCALFEAIITCSEENLFSFILHSLNLTCAHIGIRTPLVVSSSIPVDHGLRAEDRVLAICQAEKAATYINPHSGAQLYSPSRFTQSRIELRFLKPRSPVYRQFADPFVPSLSIIDVLMFNPLPLIQDWLATEYELLSAADVLGSDAGQGFYMPVASSQ